MSDNASTKVYRPWGLVLVALICAEAVGGFEYSMLNVAIPKLVTVFNLNSTDAGWALTAFFIVAGASAVIGGVLGDMFGRKRVLVVVLLLSIIGSLISLFGGSFTTIVIGRAFQGVSGAVLPLIMALSRDQVREDRVPVTIAVVAGTITLAGAGGFLLAGFLVDNLSWQGIFVASAVLATIAAALASWLLAPSIRTVKRSGARDLVGGAMFMPALALILYAATTSQAHGFTSPVVLTCAGVGLLIGVVWVLWELRIKEPLINLRLLKHRKFAMTMVVTALFSLGPIGGTSLTTAVVAMYPTAAPVGLGLTATQMGWLSFTISLVAYTAAPTSGVIARRAAARWAFVLGAFLCAVAIPATFLVRQSLIGVGIVFLIQAIGNTLALPAIPNLISEAIPQDHMGEATGFYVIVKNVFSAVSISVVSILLASSVVPGTPLPTVNAFGLAIAFLSISGAAALVVGLFLRGKAQPSEVSVMMQSHATVAAQD